MLNRQTDKPPAIVLSKVITGLATARGIGEGGIEIHAATFETREPIHFSRRCHIIDLTSIKNDEQKLLCWLIDFAKKLGNRPVLIPTCDQYALMFARNYEKLSAHCRLWGTTYHDLQRIIKKDDLYQLAETAGVSVIPAICEPSLEQLEEWIQSNPGPYFLKPFYEGITDCTLHEKNLRIPDQSTLLDYTAKYGTKSLIIQRMINGGDGYIFDCYGLCDGNGLVLTMASHRRWRQLAPDVGTTTYGEIPAKPEGKNESELFENTERLLATVKYHGIFGIEWLQDRDNGTLYLIDFNARPFTSIGHLKSCGLNLPLLAYKELVGEDLSTLELRPRLQHKYWIDLLRDLHSFQIKRKHKELTWWNWLKSTFRIRSFAYWDLSDPLPGVYVILQTMWFLILLAWKQIKR